MSVHYSTGNLPVQYFAPCPPQDYCEPYMPIYQVPGYIAVDPLTGMALPQMVMQPALYPAALCCPPAFKQSPRRLSSLKQAPRSQFCPTPSSYRPTEAQSLGSNDEYVQGIVNAFEQSGHDTSLLAGRILTLAHFQSGSRYLQRQVTLGNPDFIAFLISEVVVFLSCADWSQHRRAHDR